MNKGITAMTLAVHGTAWCLKIHYIAKQTGWDAQVETIHRALHGHPRQGVRV